jgi:hypothetical protein
MKVTTIQLLHDFQGFHLKRRHLILLMNRKTLFQTLSPWNLILSKTWRISFSCLKNLQHFEEISSTPPTHFGHISSYWTLLTLLLEGVF